MPFIVRVTKVLDDYGVDYAIVGGYAVALHGAVRGTIDLDIIVSLDKDSFIKAEAGLKSIGFQARLPV